MKDTQAAINIVNQMQQEGVIGKYAIGGAIAAAFYIEPTATYDIDIFITFDDLPASSLDPLRPIFNYLLPLNYKLRGEHILIEDWQVQFLPASDALIKEALDGAVETTIGDTKTRVMSAEHLMAIALRLGRPKDLIRVEQFVSSKVYDADKLTKILERNNLIAKWKQFNEKYIGSTNE